ncbi:MAG: nucleotidyltransferase domain-containing protein [Nitrospirae bacterium]|nr:nucleotidyltransferase domain-containing protein [Nitrospirota bacterium]
MCSRSRQFLTGEADGNGESVNPYCYGGLRLYGIMTVVAQDVLSDIVKAIVDAVHPLKVVLFGSYVHDQGRAGSDIDLLVIEEEPFGAGRSRREQVGFIYRNLPLSLIPVDVVLCSKDEFDKWKDGINHVIARACREGRVVYERD